MIKRWSLLGSLLLLLGCGVQRPLPSTLSPTAIPPTATATLPPTETASPTAVPAVTAPPTATPTVMSAPSPTATLLPTHTATAEPQTAVPAITRQSTVERWQNVAEYSFFSPSRQQEIRFTIYTPPNYDQSDEQYPVLYFLHGSQGSHILFWNAISREVTAANEDAGGWISGLIESGQIPPLIIVAPNDTDGGWGDTNKTMVTQELIQTIDGNWRTIANRNGRSLAGFSMGAAGASRYPAKNPDLYCNTMLLAESHVDEAATLWAQNQDAILASGLQVGLVVGELDTRGVNATTAVQQILTELKIPHELQIVPDVPHNFGQLYNQIGVWALQFHATCWQKYEAGD
ncbi:hypothetical protein MNBD_CHLOROFLEXI01-3635 [hydrothermal vent metagenome]|uniref:Endo-1,4-beta-xylanase A n=1 Tax=hydrothermal vent metagenome TaxID=652676 RepID=A0A3B0VSU8_9ZZZZ